MTLLTNCSVYQNKKESIMDNVGRTSGAIKKYLPFVASMMAGVGCFLWLTARAYPEFAYMKTTSIVMVLGCFLMAFVDMIGEPYVETGTVMRRLAHIGGVVLFTMLAIMGILNIYMDEDPYINGALVLALIGLICLNFKFIHESRKKWSLSVSAV
jgi:multisubunit Na+/H+ antiporter MnhF subunit